jgi:hypothetical protein
MRTTAVQLSAAVLTFLAYLPSSASAKTVCFASRSSLCASSHHYMGGCWIGRRDVALRDFCGGVDPTSAPQVGKPTSGGACGVTVSNVTCPSTSTTETATTTPAGEPSAPSFVQATSSGTCADPGFKWLGWKNVHVTKSIRVVSTVQETGGYSSDTTDILLPGQSKDIACSGGRDTFGKGVYKQLFLKRATFE